MLEKALQISNLDAVQWTFAVISISALEVIRAGIEKAGTLDRQAVYKVIQSEAIPTVLGTFKAIGHGVGTLQPFPMQVQNGKVEVIWPPEAKTADYKFPRN
jgi:branched-chain amino acid transport system substrate-binding protein